MNQRQRQASGLAQLVPTNSGQRPAGTDHRYSEGWSWVLVRGGFLPDLIEARAGERLRVVFRREETAPCSEHVVIPSLGKNVMLPPFEDVAVELGPLPAGEYEFSCEFGVLRGRILVRDGAQEFAETPSLDAASSADGGSSDRSYAALEGKESKRRLGQMKRPTINITPAERIGRVLVGLVGLIGGLILLGSAGSAVVGVLEVLLVLTGLDLIVTGALGHCPLYRSWAIRRRHWGGQRECSRAK